MSIVTFVIAHDGGFLLIFSTIALTVPFAIIFGYICGLKDGETQRRYILAKTTDIFLDIKYETDKAYKVSDGVNEEWLPKSQVEVTEETKNGAMFSIPERLAKEKGYI